ncbi:hypothetical protein ABPG73_000452 [Tetrahymena malaccensis]
MEKTEEQNESKNDILIPYFSPKSNQKVFNQFLSSEFQKTDHDNPKKENQITFKKLITQEQQFFSEETEVKRQNTDFTENQKSTNLENSNQIPKIFQLQSFQQTDLTQIKDKKESLIKGLSIIPRQQQRLKRHDWQNKISTKQNKDIQIQHKEEGFQKQKAITLNQNIEKIIFQTRPFNSTTYLESKLKQKEVFSLIKEQIDDSLDFTKFYKEILFLKKAVMILLDKEQLAALYLVGLDVKSINNNKENKLLTNLTEDNHTSHFKEQFELLQSQEIQLQYINYFLQRCQNSQNSDQIDKRLYSSLITN